MLVSVCIPCYRSAKTLPVVVASIIEEFEKWPEYDYQIVLANDGSPDNTFQVIRQLCEGNPKITGINLTRNYGQASAKLSTLQYALGDVVVMMDDDGQHPAEGIFTLLAKMEEGYDVVYAHFASKQHSFFRRLASAGHNWLAEKMGNKPKGIHRSSFAAWSRPVVDALKDYDSPFVSIGSYMMNITSKYADVEIEHQARLEGTSGYTLKKLLRMWLNIFISFSMLPLRLASYMGFSFSLIGFVMAIVLVVRKILNPALRAGYTSTIVMILFMGGLTLLVLGIIGEYIGRIYMTVSGMPQYRVRQVINAKGDDHEKYHG